jgi:hypothetical protein
MSPGHRHRRRRCRSHRHPQPSPSSAPLSQTAAQLRLAQRCGDIKRKRPGRTALHGREVRPGPSISR